LDSVYFASRGKHYTILPLANMIDNLSLNELKSFSENVSLVLYAQALLFCEKCFISFEFLCKTSCALCGSVDLECCFSVWNTFCLFDMDCAGGSTVQRCAWTGFWIFGTGLRLHPAGSGFRFS